MLLQKSRTLPEGLLRFGKTFYPTRLGFETQA